MIEVCYSLLVIEDKEPITSCLKATVGHLIPKASDLLTIESKDNFTLAELGNMITLR